MTTERPGPLQYVAYSYGKRLPDTMRTWVAQDLAGDGAVRRFMIRMAIPPLLVLAPFWLLPASLYVHIEMTVPIYAWALVMAFALNKVWRRHRLAQHNLDPYNSLIFLNSGVRWVGIHIETRVTPIQREGPTCRHTPARGWPW